MKDDSTHTHTHAHTHTQVVMYDAEPIQQRQLLGHPEEVLTCCSISVDDMYVVVGGADGSIYSWDTDT